MTKKINPGAQSKRQRKYIEYTLHLFVTFYYINPFYNSMPRLIWAWSKFRILLETVLFGFTSAARKDKFIVSASHSTNLTAILQS